MRSLLRTTGPCLQGCGRTLAAQAASGPMTMKARVEGYGEGATTLVTAESFRFAVDEPPRMGGKGIGPNPLSTLLGSLIGCTQFTASMIAREMKLGTIGSVAWSATGEYDLRGVRSTEPGVDARFTRVSLEGTFDTQLSQQDLDAISKQVDRRCIVAATLKASGLDLQLSMKKGEVDHNCEPACVLHELEDQGGATGQVKGDPGRDADAPKFAGGRQSTKAAARSFSTLSHRRFISSGAAVLGKDGEDVAREHMHADAAPQLQKETSEAGAASTAGGAYASRDDPRSQASQPTQGKSDEQIVKEQDAGATVHPDTAGRVEGGEPMEKTAAHSPSYSGRAAAGGHSDSAEAAEDEREEEELGRDVNRTDFQPWDE